MHRDHRGLYLLRTPLRQSSDPSPEKDSVKGFQGASFRKIIAELCLEVIIGVGDVASRISSVMPGIKALNLAY